MADFTHPSLDDVADLHEGLLSEERSHDVLAHIESCEACTAAMAALDQVQSMLASTGSSPVAMPAPVADALDEALGRASLERADGVPSLTERRRSQSAPQGAGRRGRWLRGLAAAAAIVVVGSGAVIALDHLGGSSSGVSSNATSAGRGRDYASGGQAGSATDPPPYVTANSLAQFGSALVARRPAASGSTTAPDKTPSAESLGGGHDGISTSLGCTPGVRGAHVTTILASWKGSPATVAVYPKSRRVAVYACGRPLVRLYSTSY